MVPSKDCSDKSTTIIKEEPIEEQQENNDEGTHIKEEIDYCETNFLDSHHTDITNHEKFEHNHQPTIDPLDKDTTIGDYCNILTINRHPKVKTDNVILQPNKSFDKRM